jgi:hypothetical protein
MFYKILEKYSNLKIEHRLTQDEENKAILKIEEDVLKSVLDLYDKDVKIIHSNQEKIERDLQYLNRETDKSTQITKHAVNIYDNFLENLKEAGDLYNWCSLLEKDMQEIHEAIALRHKPEKFESENVDEP